MSAIILRGAPIAERIRAEVAEGVAEMREKHGTVPGLAVVLATNDAASDVYVRSKERAAIEAGMESETVRIRGRRRTRFWRRFAG